MSSVSFDSRVISMIGLTSCPIHTGASLLQEPDAHGHTMCVCTEAHHRMDLVHGLAMKRMCHVTEAAQFINTALKTQAFDPPAWTGGEPTLSPWEGAPLPAVEPGIHPYWHTRGLTRASVIAFEAGVVDGRPALPIRDIDGRIQAIITRDPEFPVDKSNFPHTKPEKYTHTGSVSEMLFGLHQARLLNKPYRMIVEGPIDAMRAWEAGIPAVAINSNTISACQMRSLKAETDTLVLALDNDDLGHVFESTRLFTEYVRPFFYLHRLALPVGADPGSLTVADLRKRIEAIHPGW